MLRTAIADALLHRADLDPGRASFTIALNTARDQIVQTTGAISRSTVDLVGRIGAAVLANLIPLNRQLQLLKAGAN